MARPTNKAHHGLHMGMLRPYQTGPLLNLLNSMYRFLLVQAQKQKKKKQQRTKVLMLLPTLKVGQHVRALITNVLVMVVAVAQPMLQILVTVAVTRVKHTSQNTG